MRVAIEEDVLVLYRPLRAEYVLAIVLCQNSMLAELVLNEASVRSSGGSGARILLGVEYATCTCMHAVGSLIQRKMHFDLTLDFCVRTDSVLRRDDFALSTTAGCGQVEGPASNSLVTRKVESGKQNTWSSMTM